MKVSYKWLQEEYFDGKLPAPQEVADALLFHSFEIEGLEENGKDVVIDVDVLPNRAHDCLSHRGVARELAIITGIPFSEKKIEANFSPSETTLSVDVQDAELSRRYIGRAIRNIELKDPPEWLKDRLETLGQRSINALVDATNYVLLDIGQPTHVFDANKLDSLKINVRLAKTGETIETLDGKKIELQNTDTVIADETGALAIAGVKGGTKAEVTEATTDVVLESAHFNPVNVRKTSRRIGVLTDASKRFENEPTPELAEEAMEYLTRLIVSLCGTDKTVVEYAVDKYSTPNAQRKVVVDVEHINKLLGTELSVEEVSDICNRFGWDYQKMGDEFSITIPDDRLDLASPADIVEEIGRVYGYASIPSTPLPEMPDDQSFNKEFYYITQIKHALVEAGFSEVYTPSFQPSGKLRMANPVAQDRPFLREKIDHSEIFIMNNRFKDLLGLDEVRVFEIGNVFDAKSDERLVLSVCLESVPKDQPLEPFGIKITETYMQIDLGKVIGNLPEISSYEGLLDRANSVQMYEPFSQYPSVVRDIAAWVPENTNREELVSCIKKYTGDLLARTPRLVDEYTKDGRVSYAHRLVFQYFDKTLTDQEVGEIMKKIEEAFANKGWEVR